MQSCKVTIATTVDNKTTEIIRDGEMLLSINGARICYLDAGAEVTLVFENNVVFIERKGDYSMRLYMKKGEICEGMLGICGSEGKVQTKTTRLAYSLTESTFMLSLHYDLMVGEEAQKMRIRLFAK